MNRNTYKHHGNTKNINCINIHWNVLRCNTLCKNEIFKDYIYINLSAIFTRMRGKSILLNIFMSINTYKLKSQSV